MATVLTGAGSAHRLGEVLAGAGVSRAFVITTRGRHQDAMQVAGRLGPASAAVFADAQPHVPGTVVARAQKALAGCAPPADVLVAIGGGSAIGLAKALAIVTGLPIVALPTTYSGSEMTSIWGTTEAGTKRTGRDRRAAPVAVIYDAELAVSLPPTESAASGMNAMAHAVEALYASNATEAICRRAESAAEQLSRALPAVVARPDDLAARELAFRGAHDAGVALAGASMGLHHRLCHVLGGRFDLPHARTHAVLLPHVAAFNAPAAPEAMARLADALDVRDAPGGLASLAQRLGLTAGLRDLGLRESDLDDAARAAADGEYPNPRSATAADIRQILEAAFAGARS